MKSILFLPLHATSWGELLPLSLYLRGKAKVTVLVDNAYMAEQVPSLKQHKLEYILTYEVGKNVPDTVSKSRFSSLREMLRKSAWAKKLVGGVREYKEASRSKVDRQHRELSIKYNQKLEQLNVIFDENRFDACVVSGDRHLSGCELPLLKVCRERGIRSVIPPIAYVSDAERLLLWRTEKKYDARCFPKVAKAYPGLVHQNPRTNRGVLYFTAGTTLALAEIDALPDNPWVMGGGLSDIILADGEETRDRYIKNGCDPSKIIITGHYSHDLLHESFMSKENLKKALCEEYGFSENQKLIVLALPQLAEHGICDWTTHWQEIRFLCEAACNSDCGVLVSLHPKMDRSSYDFLESEYHLSIANGRLVEFIAAADIFVSTFSSTVQWAVLCHIPTIIVDFYGLNYSSYDFLPGVKVINSKPEMLSCLEVLVRDQGQYDRKVEQQRDSVAYISPFDGGCRVRIATAILEGRNDYE